MAIMVECPRCRKVTPFADNDAGLAVMCTACGQVTRVPDGRGSKAVPAYEPPPALGRVRGSGARPYVYAGAVLLAFGIAGAMGFLKYRSTMAWRARVVANQAANRAAATLPARPAPAAKPAIAAVASNPVESPPPTVAKPAERDSVGGPSRVIGFVGLERLELNGRYSVDSYVSAEGPYRASSAGAKAPLVSGLKVRLYGEGKVGGVVQGDDLKKADSVKLTSGAGKEPGREIRLEVPPVDVGAAERANDNDALPEKYFRGRGFVLHAGKTVAVEGGVYYLGDLVIEPRATLVLDGPATFVVTGRFIVHGNVETHGRRPGNLHVRVSGENRPVVINNSSDVYLDLYAPGHTVEVYGKGDVYGSIVGKILRVNGERGLHFDESIAPGLDGLGPPH